VATAIGIVPTAGNWSPFTATFTGSAADAGESITIRLVSTGVQGNFDDVQLTAVPEPSFMGVVGIGLAGLLAFARRNRLRLGDIVFLTRKLECQLLFCLGIALLRSKT
jgi:hypothetical protein